MKHQLPFDNKHFDHSEEKMSEMWLFLSGELPAEQMVEWREHLACCTACARLLRQTKATLERYHDLPEPALDEAFFRRSIAIATHTRRNTMRRLGSQRVWRVAVPLALAASLLLFYFQSQDRGQPDLEWAGTRIENRVQELEQALYALESGSLSWGEAGWDAGNPSIDQVLQEMDSAIDLLAEEISQN